MNRGLKIGLISLGIIAIPTAIYFIWFRKKGEGKIKGNVDGTLEEKKEKKEIVKKEKKSNPKRYTTESRPLKKYDFAKDVCTFLAKPMLFHSTYAHFLQKL